MASAASPFLVSYDSVDANSSNDATETTTDKPITLAESLVEISHCHSVEQNSTKSDSLQINDQQSPSKQTP